MYQLKFNYIEGWDESKRTVKALVITTSATQGVWLRPADAQYSNDTGTTDPAFPFSGAYTGSNWWLSVSNPSGEMYGIAKFPTTDPPETMRLYAYVYNDPAHGPKHLSVEHRIQDSDPWVLLKDIPDIAAWSSYQSRWFDVLVPIFRIGANGITAKAAFSDGTIASKVSLLDTTTLAVLDTATPDQANGAFTFDSYTARDAYVLIEHEGYRPLIHGPVSAVKVA